MAIFNLSEVLQKAGLKPEDVALIRHKLKDSEVKKHYDEDSIKEYTQEQTNEYKKILERKYWVVFMSEEGTLARLHACYVNNGLNEGGIYSSCNGEKDNDFYNLEELDNDILKELRGELVIDWGSGTRNYIQKGDNNKDVISIDSKRQFPGYEKLELYFNVLKKVIENKDYESWREALNKVKAIYLIVDTKTGDRYVGSASGDEKLLQRWRGYVKTNGLGGNMGLKEHLVNEGKPENLKFSILQVLDNSLSKQQVDDIENRWKEKLMTREFGLNEN